MKLTDEKRAENMREALATGTMVEWLRDPDNHRFASDLARLRNGPLTYTVTLTATDSIGNSRAWKMELDADEEVPATDGGKREELWMAAREALHTQDILDPVHDLV